MSTTINNDQTMKNNIFISRLSKEDLQTFLKLPKRGSRNKRNPVECFKLFLDKGWNWAIRNDNNDPVRVMALGFFFSYPCLFVSSKQIKIVYGIAKSYLGWLLNEIGFTGINSIFANSNELLIQSKYYSYFKEHLTINEIRRWSTRVDKNYLIHFQIILNTYNSRKWSDEKMFNQQKSLNKKRKQSKEKNCLTLSNFPCSWEQNNFMQETGQINFSLQFNSNDLVQFDSDIESIYESFDEKKKF